MNIEIKLNKDFERTLEDLKIKYGEEFEMINGCHPSQLDYSEFLSNFTKNNTLADSSIDPNANASNKDIRSFLMEKEKPSTKLFGLSKVFLEIKQKYGLRTAKNWFEQEYSKGFYLNDSWSVSSFGYCWANDLTRLAKEGLFFLDSYNNKPPKHLTTYFDDVIEFVSFLSNRQSGAVGLPNVIIWAYYFWKKDVENGYVLKDPDTYLRQNFQKFIYRLNQPFLRIDQTAFTNVSVFDRNYLESLFGGLEFPDGTFAIDEIEQLIECQKVFCEVVAEIRSDSMFTFPVLTASLLFKDGEFVDQEFSRWISDHNVKWMDFNFFCSDNVGVLSNCCRLLSDTTKLEGFVNSIGGTALSIGSCRVSTINLARIAYEAFEYNKPNEVKLEKAKAKYLKILRERTELDCKALDCMRDILRKNIERGLLPNYQDGAVELDKQFCTIGILGLYEVMDIFGLINTDEFGYKSYSDEAIEFGTEILSLINEVKDNFNKYFELNINNIKYKIPALAEVACIDTEDDNKKITMYFYKLYENKSRYDFNIKDIAKFIVR